MSKRLGVLIHGAGWVSTQHTSAFQKNPHTEVVAISSRRLESARRLARTAGLDIPCFDDYRRALALPAVDIVVICTPQHVHAENTIAAARAGKHLVIEKPVAQTLEEMRAMLQAVRLSRVKTVVSFVLRWNPLFQKLKQLSAQGTFGEIYCVETDYQSYIGDWWRAYGEARTKAMGGSAFLVGGCHAIDALRWFAGEGEFEAASPVEVFAYCAGKRGQSTRQYDPYKNNWHEGASLEYPGLEMALVQFSNGVLGKVSVNVECIQPYTFPVRIFGNKGTAFDHHIWSPAATDRTGWLELPEVRPDSSDVTHHPFQGQIDHFVQCIQNDQESHCNLEDAAKTHEVIFAAQQCYQSGRPVPLPLM